MKKLEVLKQTIVTKSNRAGLLLKKHSPEILMGVGVAGVVGSTILACKATLKVEELIDESKEQLNKIEEVRSNEDISDEKYSEEDAKKDRTIVYIQSGVKFAKLYAPAVILGTASVGCLIGSHVIMKKRNLAVVAAYKAVEKSFSDYRGRVIDELGVDKDNQFKHGQVKTKVDVISDDGLEVTEEEIDIEDPNHYSQYARFYDDGNASWSKNPEYNLMFLKSQQNYANDLLKARGHIFLNEVYDMLGIPRTTAGSVVGWVMDKDGDNFVDFGMYDGNKLKARDFVNGYERSILLDFNVDGVIYDLI